MQNLSVWFCCGVSIQQKAASGWFGISTNIISFLFPPKKSFLVGRGQGSEANRSTGQLYNENSLVCCRLDPQLRDNACLFLLTVAGRQQTLPCWCYEDLASVLWFHGGVYNVPQALSRDQAETKVLQELGQQDTSFNLYKREQNVGMLILSNIQSLSFFTSNGV